MSTSTMSFALNMKGLSDREFRTIIVIAEKTGMDTVCTSVEGLMEAWECDEREVSARIREVSDKGLIGPLSIRNRPVPFEARLAPAVVGYFDPRDQFRDMEDDVRAAPAPATKAGKQVIPKALRTAVFERDEYRCQAIGCGSFKDLRVDHIHPESKGGELKMDNLQTLCGDCNRRKGARVPFTDLEG